MITWIVLSLALVQGSETGTSTCGAADDADVEAVGRRLRRAVQDRQIDEMVALVNPSGVECGDAWVPAKNVQRDLKTPGTELHSLFFDSERLNEKFGIWGARRWSWREFFSHGRDIEMSIRQPLACVRLIVFMASNIDNRLEVAVAKVGGKWRISEDPSCQRLGSERPADPGRSVK